MDSSEESDVDASIVLVCSHFDSGKKWAKKKEEMYLYLIPPNSSTSCTLNTKSAINVKQMAWQLAVFGYFLRYDEVSCGPVDVLLGTIVAGKTVTAVSCPGA